MELTYYFNDGNLSSWFLVQILLKNLFGKILILLCLSTYADNWANLHCCKWTKYWTIYSAIWSHNFGPLLMLPIVLIIKILILFWLYTYAVYWANFHCCKWTKYWTNHSSIWSHKFPFILTPVHLRKFLICLQSEIIDRFIKRRFFIVNLLLVSPVEVAYPQSMSQNYVLDLMMS